MHFQLNSWFVVWYLMASLWWGCSSSPEHIVGSLDFGQAVDENWKWESMPLLTFSIRYCQNSEVFFWILIWDLKTQCFRKKM